MAIVRGNVSGNAGGGANLTWNHDCSSEVASILLVFTEATSGDVTAVTYAGIPMAEEQEYSSVGGSLKLWYLLYPPTGVNAVLCTNAAPQAVCGIAVDYSGVDQLIPFGTIQGLHASVNNSGPALLDEILTAEEGWMCVDGASNGRFSEVALNLTEGAGQTSLSRQTFWDGVNNSGSLEVSEELAIGPATTMSWTGMAGCDDWGQLAIPLRPAVAFAVRPIEYTLDAWDLEQRILDSRGHVVPRCKIKPNNWARIVGLESTTAEVYDSNYDDPTLVFFEAVQYDGEMDQVEITTNRGDLPEVILAQLASGSTG